MPNLTDISIKTLAPGLHFDAKLKSFGIRILKNRKTWVVIKGPNRTKVSIGHYPQLSLQDARRKAQLALASPLDPRPSLAFPEARDAFLAQSKWRPRSKKVLESSLRHFEWTRPLDRITHEDVAGALDKIAGQSARAHALKDIRAFFNWCVPRYLAATPAAGLKMASQPTRSRVLSDDELARVWIAAEKMGYPFGTIVQLLILTGQRKSEIGSLQWEWIKEDRITLPATVTKNGREHSFPVGSYSHKLLARIRPSPTTLPFLGKNGVAYNGYAFHLKQLHKLSGTSDWTLHDLRRTFATGLAALNVPIHVTEKLLNHVSGTTGGLVAVYQRHNYWSEQMQALQAWEDKVQSLARSG